MSRIRSGRVTRVAGAALAALLTCTSEGRPQDVTPSSLKAALIYNFAKFTEWPEDVLPATATFTACVLGDDPIQDALVRLVKGQLLSGRGVRVSQVQLNGALRSCQLLYVSSITLAQVGTLLSAVRGAPVLTISEVDDFAHQGGIVRIFVEDGKMRFELNLGVAKRSRLLLSSKLLALAARIYDDPKAAGQSTGETSR